MSIETSLEPIMLDVDLSVESHELDTALSMDAYDLDVDTKVENITINYDPLPEGGSPGDLLVKKSGEDYDAWWVPPATSVEQDNTRPITSGAVYTEIGNINALLATI